MYLYFKGYPLSPPLLYSLLPPLASMRMLPFPPNHSNLSALALPYIGETSLHRTKGFSNIFIKRQKALLGLRKHMFLLKSHISISSANVNTIFGFKYLHTTYSVGVINIKFNLTTNQSALELLNYPEELLERVYFMPEFFPR